MLDVTALSALTGSAQSDIFRMETLPAYAVPSDGGDFGRYLAGAPGPDPARKAAWQAKLRAERARGVRRWRVYVAHEPLSSYSRFECEWGHALNAGLEDIRVLSLSITSLRDFLIIDNHTVAAMHYNGEGGFLGAEMLPQSVLPIARQARDIAWAHAEPFTAWWEAHPQYHRHEVAA